MAEQNLTQAEADALIAMEKHRADEAVVDFPGAGDRCTVPLKSADRREEFFLDIRRGRIDLAKVTYQNRARTVVVLVRLDLGGGGRHRNPDGEEIPEPHLHVYREGYGDKWAHAVPPDRFGDLADAWAALDDFMSYCGVTVRPHLRRNLFT